MPELSVTLADAAARLGRCARLSAEIGPPPASLLALARTAQAAVADLEAAIAPAALYAPLPGEPTR